MWWALSAPFVWNYVNFFMGEGGANDNSPLLPGSVVPDLKGMEDHI